MATILKNASAPDGELYAAFGVKSFKVSDDAGYDTDDVQLIEEAEAHPFLKVEYGEDSSKDAARAETKDIKALQKEQARVDKQRAEKDPLEPAAPYPETVEQLQDIKGENS